MSGKPASAAPQRDPHNHHPIQLANSVVESIADPTRPQTDTRRSGRATKGVTTKNKDIPDGAEQPKSSKKGKAKPAKKDNQPGPDEEEDDDEENAIIRCICGQ
jgi:hypothetical protein